MYSVQTLVYGNVDKGQDPKKPPYGVAVTTLEAKALDDLKHLVFEWQGQNDIGSGNWGNPPVHRNGKLVGYMSYNGRVWLDKRWKPETEEFTEAI